MWAGVGSAAVEAGIQESTWRVDCLRDCHAACLAKGKGREAANTPTTPNTMDGACERLANGATIEPIRPHAAP
eukprot:CAMPEP_0174726912 /NCGR_PEP_ID=MMETSP1094-20130205/48683_1 /TAXON_ID=156173 /ORGANISM="Chrysochromulina brevifilum, Strain UTEX LB 985" /LENGTH=72 /DNA_ID=CAMNT_0015928545 /DNA_START=182 /DNA_END=401 /DNA_ORIENTATION=+